MYRQYIGARYKAKFYENSINPLSCEWEENVIYEALTIVTYLNDSYTSKKLVPVTIGNPRNNPEYWCLTGAYNAQVEEYRQEAVEASEKADSVALKVGDIDDLETTTKTNIVSAINEIVENSSIKTHTFLIISDSYGTEVNGVTPYSTRLASKLNADSYNVYLIAEGGVGYNRASGSTGHTAQQMVQANISNVPDTDAITDIICTIGINDILNESSYSDVQTSEQTFITYLKTTFPNAKLHFGFAGYMTLSSSANVIRYLELVNIMRKLCNDNGIKYILNIEKIMHNLLLKQSDGVHPNTDGAYYLANFIYQYLNGGSNDVTFENTSASFVIGQTTRTAFEKIMGDISSIVIPSFSSQSIVLTKDFSAVATFSGNMIASAHSEPKMFVDRNNELCEMYVYNNSLYVRRCITAGTCSGWTSNEIMLPTMTA